MIILDHLNALYRYTDTESYEDHAIYHDTTAQKMPACTIAKLI